MKRLSLAVALLILGASAALADGSGLPPINGTKPPKARVIRLADGSGLPPINSTTKPPKGRIAA